MNTKLVVLLGSVGALHMVVGGLFLASGCAKEDPPMPPGIYVPKNTAANPADTSSAAPETVYPATIPDSDLYQPTTIVEPAPQPKPVKTSGKKATAPADSKGTAYVVVKGDSLWKIAKKHHITIENLALYNDLPANAKLRIGQKLLIPASDRKVSAPAPQVVKAKANKKASAKANMKKTKAPAAGKKTVSKKHKELPADGIYVVKSGDNFSLIAKRYGLKVSDIAAANPGVDSSRLKVGQKLQLSGTATAVTLPAKDPKPVVTGPIVPAENSTAAPTVKQTSNDDMDSLLDEVSKEPEENSAAKMGSDAAPNATDEAIKAVSSDSGKDSVLQDAEPYKVAAGDPTTYIIGEKGCTLTALCNDFHVNEDEVKKLNPSLPADGNLKPGTHVKMP